MLVKSLFYLIPFFILVSCKQKITETDLQFLTGYWEIEKVILPNGETKDYKINETIDFFELKDKIGFRQKLIPQLDGTYLTNNLQEKIELIDVDGITMLKYQTDYATWREEIVSISKEKLVLKNEQDLEYHYKKPVAFTIK